MGTSIVLTSGKGGTGKTTCTAAIGSYLALAGHRTLCVDCDAALRNLDIVLGLSDRVLWDFIDVAEGRTELDAALTPHPKLERLFFLSAPVDLVEHPDGAALERMMEELRDRFEFVLLDSPAGIGPGFRLAASMAETAYIVSTCDSSSLRDGQRTAWELRDMGITELRLLINRVRPRALRRIDRTLDDVIDSVGARLLGVISEDPSVGECGSLQTPLPLYGARKAAKQFKDIAARVAGERVKLGRI